MPHYLRRNAETRIPRHHVVVDTETTQDPLPGRTAWDGHKLMMGVARYGHWDGERWTRQSEVVFHERHEFWEWLYGRAARGNRVWVWAHNAGFDFTVLGLWSQLDQGEVILAEMDKGQATGGGGREDDKGTPPTIVTGSPPFLADCKHRSGRSYRFVDSCNWAFLGLDKIGAALGLEKLPMPGDAADEGDWLAYCKRDVEILQLLVARILNLVGKYDLGNMQWTLSGQALSHYRHKHWHPGILVGPDERTRPLERKAYYGARTECFYRGHTQQAGGQGTRKNVRGAGPGECGIFGRVYRLDCNACYPHVMGSHDYPTHFVRRLYRPHPARLRRLLDHFIGVAVLRVFSLDEPYPQRKDNRVSWRVMNVDTALCGPELVRALDSGHVQCVEEVQLYARAPIFRSWYEETQAWREGADCKTDPLTAMLLKRMRNSLHGKFGQSARSWQVVPGRRSKHRWGEYQEIDADLHRVIRYRGIAGILQQLGTDDTAHGASPIVAACVTAHAREHMRSARLLCPPRSVYYEDADSLHVGERGYQALLDAGRIDPASPGKFKVVDVALDAEYYGPKNYRLGAERVLAGRSPKGHLDASGNWHQTEWVKLDGLLSTGLPEVPITYVRAVGESESDSRVGYDADGWIQYRPGQ